MKPTFYFNFVLVSLIALGSIFLSGCGLNQRSAATDEPVIVPTPIRVENNSDNGVTSEQSGNNTADPGQAGDSGIIAPTATQLPTNTPLPTATQLLESTPLPTATQIPQSSGPIIHVVQAGQTLFSIAQSYGITVNELVSANGIVNPNWISVGQQLIIPAPSTVDSSDIGAAPALEYETPDIEAIIKVFFATNRRQTNEPALNFEGTRSENSKITYGSMMISIPKAHEVGVVEEPFSIDLGIVGIQLQQENQAKHIVIQTGATMQKSQFFNEIKESNKSKAFIFIHGFNVSFEDAAKRSAQIAHDLNFDGLPVFYSWPARGGVLNYVTDKDAIEFSEPLIETFLKDFAEQSDVEEIYVIAHSMGTKGFSNAYVEFLEKNPELGKRFNGIILAAPDIDAQNFRNEIVPKMIENEDWAKVTIYTSSADNALAASRQVHGESKRVGYSGDGVFIQEGIQTIDITDADTLLDFLGHSTFADRREILVDIHQILDGKLDADDRFGLIRVYTDNGVHWTVK